MNGVGVEIFFAPPIAFSKFATNFVRKLYKFDTNLVLYQKRIKFVQEMHKVNSKKNERNQSNSE